MNKKLVAGFSVLSILTIAAIAVLALWGKDALVKKLPAKVSDKIPDGLKGA